MATQKINYWAGLANDREVDVSACVDLLKLTFPSSKHSVEKFTWKHISNPHGPSIVALAFSDERVIGVRAFWKLKFCFQGDPIIAFQPCDTATHFDYQRKGVFTRLTNMSLDLAKEKRADIIFNFPNHLSYKGNRKLGWVELGNLNRYVRPQNYITFPPKICLDYIRNTKTEVHEKLTFGIGQIDAFLNCCWVDKNKMNLDIDHQYLNWRFFNHPTYSYQMIIGNESCGIGRTFNRGRFRGFEIGLGLRNLDWIFSVKDTTFYSAIAESSNLHLKSGFLRAPNSIRYFGKIINPNLSGTSINFEPALIDTI